MDPGRRFLRWSLVGVLVAVVLAYLTVVGWFMANEVALVFAPNRTVHPLPADIASQIERVTPGASDGVLWVWRQPDAAAPWVLYLHGNAANLGTPANVTRYRQLHALGVQVIAPEYPGFGELPGIPTEAGTVAAARGAWDWLRRTGVAPSRIAVYGWSLGSGVATQLASRVDERAVVLEGAFTGIDDRGRELYPWLPVGMMLSNVFASRDQIGAIGSPLLLLHARDDQIVPLAHGERLLQAARAPRRLVVLTGGHIRANLRDEATYLDALRTFFGEVFGT